MNTDKHCSKCKEKGVNFSPESVSYIVYESSQARMERQIKRLWIALIIAVCLFFVSNAIWIYAWTQYDYESYQITADGSGNANYIGQDGDIYNGGFDKSKTTNQKE